ncbi:hypothetical protein HanXRQr2_Chr14g0654231 [Helianthus annuus]|uniref:Uncharacterized protein n=1 Tax=Helianthus annuus TaxID=4232 RepID=A0A9K3H8M3_HELAN|nr:hypothetical protein HanXRQr2_Chr14g0654231 [Helianthus annuus]KAJ0464917.1 hypothetical protein HanHA300_Chr14g0532641 [Helianthus annuus]KAJ0486510.1 hypothetical protein HanHA89_Chr14g0580461 [Helianthus annuus]KAJ0657076.1 hypothetical protein HanLR1_Chr14g0543041 [Helianthus annuus]KAJ0660655.1 hypothetical protein HanOQP8_Chr14g0540181 [Helianthus annuus]
MKKRKDYHKQIHDLNNRNLSTSFFKLFLRIFSFISGHSFLKLLRKTFNKLFSLL